MGLKKMALCSSSHTSFWPLMRIANWHVTSESMSDALAIIIDKHRKLPLSNVWGQGLTSSSDGQFFPSGGSGEAMNLVNVKYGKSPGVKAYTHFSDQYGPYASKPIPSTVNEAPYILDGLTMNEAGKRVKEHYADTGGFTDHVFAMCALLGLSVCAQNKKPVIIEPIWHERTHGPKTHERAGDGQGKHLSHRKTMARCYSVDRQHHHTSRYSQRLSASIGVFSSAK